MKRYLIKNHLAVVAILISVCIPIVSILIQYNLGREKITTYHYFAKSFDTSQQKEPIEKADCWVRSLVSNRSDAFRCAARNLIYDPCFQDPFNMDIVACPGNPLGKNEYFKVNISEVVQNESIHKELQKPWFVYLYNGYKCNFITGATLTMADRRMDYLCEGYDETDNFLLLPIKKDNDLLKIGCMIGGKIDECEIKEAWY